MRVRAYLFATMDLEYVEFSLGACAQGKMGQPRRSRATCVADELGIPSETVYVTQDREMSRVAGFYCPYGMVSRWFRSDIAWCCNVKRKRCGLRAALRILYELLYV